jgi:hypothetical protein
MDFQSLTLEECFDSSFDLLDCLSLYLYTQMSGSTDTNGLLRIAVLPPWTSFTTGDCGNQAIPYPLGTSAFSPSANPVSYVFSSVKIVSNSG